MILTRSSASYHFLTQPLPTPLAWYAAQLPPNVLKFATGGMFFIELVLPFLIFSPCRLRFFAAFGILLLQSCILITGNYNWFNLQAMLLCLPLFDDAAIQKVLPPRFAPLQSIIHWKDKTPRRPVAILAISALASLIVFCSVVEMDARFGGRPPAVAQAIDRFVWPLHITSPYGLFAVMTTERDEIIIEGSYDGVEWREYAALEDPRRLVWFSRLLEAATAE